MWLRHARSIPEAWVIRRARFRPARSGRGRSFPAHELGEERDPVSRPEGGVEGVLDAEHRIVDEHLDVLAQLVAVPEGPLELREPRREALEHTPDRRARGQRLVHDAPAPALAAHGPRGP